MTVQEKSNKQLMELLNEWYEKIRLYHVKEAKTHYEKAEKLLLYIPNEIEKAEFEYRVSTYCYQSYQPFEAIQHVVKAKKIYLDHVDYGINIALCDNVFGLACIDLREFEKAEECLNTVIDVFNKHDEEHLLLRARYTLG